MTTTPPLLPILCEDLMIEILSWLPVKSLVRFRCVSKFFKFLISNPNFVKLHLQRSPKNANILVKMRDSVRRHFLLFRSVSSLIDCPSSIDFQDLSLDWGFNLKQHKYDLVGSCNGLVCLVTKSHYSPTLLNEEYHVRLWNPATKLRSQKSPSLLVDPQVHPCDIVFGFGYDSSSDMYKVVYEFWYLDYGNMW
ncbi:F-box-like domain superfamily [Sesbania bispinosa]|nr:F-box-like domain superfamily [Sesbania bispinosa]